MKKSIAMLMVMSCFCLMAMPAIADQNTTTLTLTVPAPEDPTYVLSIPESQEIPCELGFHEIGNVTVSESSDFTEDQVLRVTVSSDYLLHKTDGTETIEFMPRGYGHKELGATSGQIDMPFTENANPIIFNYDTDGALASIGMFGDIYLEGMEAQIPSGALDDAVPGTYSGTINFVAEIMTKN